MTIQEAFPEMMRLVGKVRFFPNDTEVIMSISSDVIRFADQPERLQLLVNAFIDEIGEWHGIKEFRGVWCTRWKPADGIETSSTIPGFREADSESGTSSRALIEPEIKARALERGQEPKYLPLPPEEIRANRELVAKVDATKLKGLEPLEDYVAPGWLRA